MVVTSNAIAPSMMATAMPPSTAAAAACAAIRATPGSPHRRAERACGGGDGTGWGTRNGDKTGRWERETGNARWVIMLCSCRQRSEHRDDFPGDPHALVRLQPHEWIPLVPILRLQPDAGTPVQNRLHRRLFIDHDHADVPMLDPWLRAHDHVISLIDLPVHHAVSLHPQGEELRLIPQQAIDRQIAFDILGGEDRRARGHTPKDGDPHGWHVFGTEADAAV